jgi:hypothetical protein
MIGAVVGTQPLAARCCPALTESRRRNYLRRFAPSRSYHHHCHAGGNASLLTGRVTVRLMPRPTTMLGGYDCLRPVAPSPGRYSGHPLEGARESGFRFVADIGGDARDIVAAITQPIRRQLDAPARDVVDRRPAEQRIEAFGQHRARGAGRAPSSAVHLRADGVPSASARHDPDAANHPVVSGQAADVAPQHLDNNRSIAAEYHLRAGYRC